MSYLDHPAAHAIALLLSAIPADLGYKTMILELVKIPPLGTLTICSLFSQFYF